jgi:PKD repeat protein
MKKTVPVKNVKRNGWSGLVLLAMFALIMRNSNAQISFNVSVNSGCTPLMVNFTNTSTIGNYYEWNFGDSGFSTAINPVFTYVNTGWWNPQLNAYDTTGGGMNFLGSYTLPGGISVSGNEINCSADSACPGEQMSFYINPQPNSFNWNFGDGSPLVSQSGPLHSYVSAGTYTVSCVINGMCGMDTITRTVIIAPGAFPGAQFWQPQLICPGDAAHFDPRNDQGMSYTWNFGDGNISSLVHATHAYASPGDYPVTMSITGSCGQTSSRTDTVHVRSNVHFYSNTNMYSSSSNACPGDPIYFWYNTDASSQVWHFGTADSSLAISPTYSYPSAGTYTVTVKLTNGCGLDTLVSKVITIGNNLPFGGNPGMQISGSPACANDVVSFSCSGAANYLWDFGDGTTSIYQNSNHAYSANGTYPVTLTLYNGCGMDTVLNGSVIINSGVTPVVSHLHNQGNSNWGTPDDNPTACPGDSLLFYAMGGASYLFDFGDGFTTSQTTPITVPGQGQADILYHAFAAAGTYTVSLTYFNHCGNSATDSLTVVIGNGLPVSGNIVTAGNNFDACTPVMLIASGGNYYQWDFGDGNTQASAQSVAYHQFNTPGSYTVSVIVSNGCGNTATYTQNISVNPCAVGIGEPVSGAEGFSVYPNPGAGDFTIKASEETAFVLLDAFGRTIRKIKVTNGNSLNEKIEGLDNGVYYLHREGKKSGVQKIIVVK